MENFEKGQCSVDWGYIFDHCIESKYEIPYFYDKKVWNIGETYRMRVSNIYDPSKFWIVLLERELDLFQNFLMKFYQNNGELYIMSSDFIKIGTYCVVYVDEGYYRGYIVEIPYLQTEETKAMVFLFDYGYMASVILDNIYFLAEKFYRVPRFAVRAVLTGIQPQKSHMWTLNVVNRFWELVSGKILLCLLDIADPKERTVYVHLVDVDELFHTTDIGDKLINENHATVVSRDGISQNSASKFLPLSKYPFLFPTFDAIERCLMPSDVSTLEILKTTTSSSILLKPYFKYNLN